ncbi:MAG: pyridoxamine 5'-phosphate oxidase family protein [Pseudoramibacter sp.]
MKFSTNASKHPGIVSVATASPEGKPHIANTWNKYLIVTDDEKILIPCFGFRNTEKNAKANDYMEITLGSD